MLLTRRQKVTLTTFVTVMIVVLLANLVMVAPYLLAVVTGGLLSIVGRRPYVFLRGYMRETFASLLVTSGIALLVIGPVIGFAVRAIDQGVSLAAQVKGFKGLSPENLLTRVMSFEPIRAVVGQDPAAVETKVRNGLQEGLTTLTTALVAFVGNLPELGLQLILALLSCYFLLKDGGTFVRWCRDKLPLDEDVRENLTRSFRDTTISVIIATIAAATVQSAIMVIAFLVLRVPAAALAGGATFFFAWIPVLGSTPVWLAGAAYLYFQGSVVKAIVMIGFGLFTSVADNFVRPLVLKGRGDMHPLTSLVAIFGGIHFFGILGVFFGPILVAIAIAVLKAWPAIQQRFQLVETHPSFLTSASSVMSVTSASSPLKDELPFSS